MGLSVALGLGGVCCLILLVLLLRQRLKYARVTPIQPIRLISEESGVQYQPLSRVAQYKTERDMSPCILIYRFFFWMISFG